MAKRKRLKVAAPVEPEYVDIEGASKLLTLPVNTIRSYVSTRRIPHAKVPGSNLLRFSVKKLRAWIESGEQQTVGEYLDE